MCTNKFHVHQNKTSIQVHQTTMRLQVHKKQIRVRQAWTYAVTQSPQRAHKLPGTARTAHTQHTSRLLRNARLKPALGLEHDRDRQGPCQGRPRLDFAHEHESEEQQRLTEQRTDPRATHPGAGCIMQNSNGSYDIYRWHRQLQPSRRRPCPTTALSWSSTKLPTSWRRHIARVSCRHQPSKS